MIRDLAEETVDGSDFDDFSASSMLAIIGRQVGVMSNWFVQSPNDMSLAEETIDGSDFDDFSASSMLAIIGRQVGVMSNWFVQSPRSCRRNGQLLMISVLLLCWQQSGDRLGLCLIGFFKVRDLAEETVNGSDGSAFDDFSASSMLATIGRQVGVMSNWFVQSPNDWRSCRRNS